MDDALRDALQKVMFALTLRIYLKTLEIITIIMIKKKQTLHVACRVHVVYRRSTFEHVQASALLLERFGHRGVGDVDLLVVGAGGGKLLPGVRRVQVPPEVGQRLGDGEFAVL